MSVVAKLYDALANDSGVSTLVGARIYYVILPQRPTLPAITLQRISNSPQSGTSTVRESRWQIDGYASDYDARDSLGAAIKSALEDYISPQSNGTVIKYTRIVDELDDYDEETDLFRASFDAILITNGD